MGVVVLAHQVRRAFAGVHKSSKTLAFARTAAHATTGAAQSAPNQFVEMET